MSEMQISVVERVNREISKELTAETANALLATTFKGLNVTSMKQAIMEGMIRGHDFKDFLQKDVYALPYGQGYSLVTSIDLNRKIAMRSGLLGKSAPVYTYVDDKIESCSVTVKRLVGSHIAEFTSLVFFSEFTTGKNLWLTKPKMMIAKVAEMHALRMAFPEEMAKQYVEEEIQSEISGSFSNRFLDVKEDLKMGNFLKTHENKEIENKNEGSESSDTDFRP